MDQVKIGKFISECRKEQKMTQAILAEKLGITDRAVSKWETGKSLPDSSIMLELCDLLSINVNELLKGERIKMDEKENVSEELIINLKKQNEDKTRLLLKLEIYMGVMVVLICISQIIIGVFLKETNQTASTALILVNCVIIIIFAFIGVWIERQAGYYECAECGYTYRPSFGKALIAPHIGKNRKMTCPECGKRCYHNKVISSH